MSRVDRAVHTGGVVARRHAGEGVDAVDLSLCAEVGGTGNRHGRRRYFPHGIQREDAALRTCGSSVPAVSVGVKEEGESIP